MNKLASFAAALFLVATSNATALTVEEKRCIFAAALKMSHVAGLEIIGSRVTKAPPELVKRERSFPMTFLVEIDVRVAAQDMTLQYFCGLGKTVQIEAWSIGLR